MMRSGSQLLAMSPDRLRKIFAEGKPDWLEEHTEEKMPAHRIIDLLDTQAFFDLLKIEYPSTREGVINKLLDERLIDQCGEFYQIRRLGALLLAKTVNAFPEISRKVPRVVIFNGTSKVNTKLDVTGAMGYAVGFQKLVGFVMSHLPQNEVVQDALRREVKLLPSVIIRELVGNALIHQDFLETGTSVMVEIYNNRVEISNPGEPSARATSDSPR